MTRDRLRHRLSALHGPARRTRPLAERDLQGRRAHRARTRPRRAREDSSVVLHRVLSAIALVMALVAGAAERLGGPGAAERLNLPSHSDFYGIASIIMFVFAAVVAPELLCRDRRERRDQSVSRAAADRDRTTSSSRWAAFLTVMIAAAWLPQIILFLGLSGGDPAPMEYLAEALAGHSEVPRRRRRDGGVRHDARDAHRVVHDAPRLRVCVSRRAVRHHDAVHGRPRPGSRRGAAGNGSRCSTSRTSLCT